MAVLILIVIVLAVIQFIQGIRIHKLQKEVKELKAITPKDTKQVMPMNVAKVQVADEEEKTRVKIDEKVNTNTKVSTNVSVSANTSANTKVNVNANTNVKVKNRNWQKIFTVESIISKLGIVMLLISVGFIFKLAYDNGYITEHIAVAIGALIGLSLIGFGKHVKSRGRQVLSQVLYGGGIATLYITIYGAYQGYGLINDLLAFILMVGTTVIAFSIALSQDSVSVAFIGVLGGLLTPFVISLKQIGIMGVGAYIFIIALLAMGIYFLKQWRVLQLSNIVGTNIILIILMAKVQFTGNGQVQLTFLIFALYVLYVGIEYTIFYMGRDRGKGALLSYVLFVIIPFISILQAEIVNRYLPIELAIIFSLLAVIYAILFTLFYRKQGNKVNSSIQIILTAVFLMLAMVVYFEGNATVLGIMFIGLIYLTINRKLKSKVMAISAHVLMGIGFIGALEVMVEDILMGRFGLGTFIVRILVVGIMVLVALMYEGYIKLIYTSAAFFLYALIAIVSYAFHFGEGWEPLSFVMISFALYLVALYYLMIKRSLLPRIGIIIASVLPIFLRLIVTIMFVSQGDIDVFTSLSVIFYGGVLYLLAWHWTGREKSAIPLWLKVIGITFIGLTLLVDLSILSDRFAYGLIALYGLIWLLRKLDRDKDEAVMIVFGHIMRVLWLFMVFAYLQSVNLGEQLELVLLILHTFILVAFYLVTYSYKKYISEMGMVLGNIVMFIMATYRTFILVDNGEGTTTLLWAAYAIFLLVISVLMNKKELVNIALGYIVFVAVKFVFVDLSSVDILWKIIISMLFGSALLILSYFLQPMLNKGEEKEGS